MAGVLQHLRSSTLDKRPNPASMVDGQIAINYASGAPGMFFKDSNGSLVKVGPVHVGSGAPNAVPASGGTAGNSIGEQWLDTSGGTYVFKIWDGAAWRSEAGEFVNATGDTMTGDLVMNNANLVFEGSVDDGFETTLTVVNPTADRTITLPNVTGTVVTTGDSGTVTSTMIADGTIVNADVNASAAIAGTKISPNFGSQNVTTTGTSTAASFIPTSSSVPTNGVYLPSANNVAISTNGTGRLFVDASGRVGLGVAAPDHSFQLNGATAITLGVAIAPNGWNLRHRFSVPTVGNEAVISCNYNGSTVDDAAYATSSATFSPGLIRFATNGANAAPTERMRLDSSGRLGLGTSAPQSLLHVKTASQFDVVDADGTAGIFIEQSGGTAASGAYSTALTLSKINSGRPGAAVAAVQTSADDDQLGLAFLTHSSALSNDTLSEAMRITHAGLVGIGTTSPAQLFHVQSTNTNTAETIAGFGNQSIFTGLQITTNGNLDWGFNAVNTRNLTFSTNQLERARIDSSGRLLVGTSSARATGGTTFTTQVEGTSGVGISIVHNPGTAALSAGSLTLGRSRGTAVGSNTAVANNDALGYVTFAGANGTDMSNVGAQIGCFVDGEPFTSGDTTDLPGRLVFSTTADGASSPTEALRISSDQSAFFSGRARFGANSGYTDTAQVSIFTSAAVVGCTFDCGATSLERTHVSFENSNGIVGTIKTSGSATSYNTSSDYRLKENVVPLTGAMDRLNQLQVHRFNFIADPDCTVDGFLAHEAQAVVPECVTGTKDEVDDEGNPVYQGIDQSKLVPLLTAALQEALAKIETLEARLDAAGIS